MVDERTRKRDKAESEYPGSAFLVWGRNAVIPGKLDFNFGGINQLKVPSLACSGCVHALKKAFIDSIAGVPVAFPTRGP